MNRIKAKIFKTCRLIRGLFPQALPVGMSAFDTWANSLVSTYTLPTQDMTTIKFVLSTLIMRLGQTTAYKSNLYFVLAIKAGAAKQVAAAAFQDIKTKQEEQQKAAEVTAQAVTSNGQSG